MIFHPPNCICQGLIQLSFKCTWWFLQNCRPKLKPQQSVRVSSWLCHRRDFCDRQASRGTYISHIYRSLQNRFFFGFDPTIPAGHMILKYCSWLIDFCWTFYRVISDQYVGCGINSTVLSTLLTDAGHKIYDLVPLTKPVTRSFGVFFDPAASNKLSPCWPSSLAHRYLTRR